MDDLAARGLVGLQDAPRPGRVRRYGAEVERRVLAALDQKPPAGRAKWTARLLARALGDIPRHHIWRILHSHGIDLQRRCSWCISTDPEFAPKAADIVGLYLNPPEGAVVLSVDEKPNIQVLERAQGYLKLPNGLFPLHAAGADRPNQRLALMGSQSEGDEDAAPIVTFTDRL